MALEVRSYISKALARFESGRFRAFMWGLLVTGLAVLNLVLMAQYVDRKSAIASRPVISPWDTRSAPPERARIAPISRLSVAAPKQEFETRGIRGGRP